MSSLFCLPYGSSGLLLARLRAWDGDYLLQADVDAVAYTVIDEVSGLAVTSHDDVALVVASVIYDTLQTPSDNPLWSVDAVGFNFSYAIANPPSPFPERAKRYLVRVEFELAAGPDFLMEVAVDT